MPPVSDDSHPGLSRGRAAEILLHSECLSEEERLDRLVADSVLLHEIRRANFEGEDWEFVVNELARYGIAVIRGWLRQGVIAAKCRAKRLPCPTIPAFVSADNEACTDIATETVGVALHHYRDDVLARGVWDPKKGASLKTFFVGQCLMRFPNAFRSWQRNDQQPLEEVAMEEPGEFVTTHLPPVEDDVIRSVMAEQVLAGATNGRGARVMAMEACGYTGPEIAADLGVSADTVKSILNEPPRSFRRLFLWAQPVGMSSFLAA